MRIDAQMTSAERVMTAVAAAYLAHRFWSGTGTELIDGRATGTPIASRRLSH
jgi:hypothetical protein